MTTKRSTLSALTIFATSASIGKEATRTLSPSADASARRQNSDGVLKINQHTSSREKTRHADAKMSKRKQKETTENQRSLGSFGFKGDGRSVCLYLDLVQLREKRGRHPLRSQVKRKSLTVSKPRTSRKNGCSNFLGCMLCLTCHKVKKKFPDNP